MSSDNIKLNLQIILFFVVGLGLSALFIWATTEWKEIFIFSILISLLLYYFTYKIKSKYAVIKVFCYIASLPIKIIAEWFRYMQPSLTILFSYLIIALYAFGTPFLLLKGLSFLFQFHF